MRRGKATLRAWGNSVIYKKTFRTKVSWVLWQAPVIWLLRGWRWRTGCRGWIAPLGNSINHSDPFPTAPDPSLLYEHAHLNVFYWLLALFNYSSVILFWACTIIQCYRRRESLCFLSLFFRLFVSLHTCLLITRVGYELQFSRAKFF